MAQPVGTDRRVQPVVTSGSGTQRRSEISGDSGAYEGSGSRARAAGPQGKESYIELLEAIELRRRVWRTCVFLLVLLGVVLGLWAYSHPWLTEQRSTRRYSAKVGLSLEVEGCDVEMVPGSEALTGSRRGTRRARCGGWRRGRRDARRHAQPGWARDAALAWRLRVPAGCRRAAGGGGGAPHLSGGWRRVEPEADGARRADRQPAQPRRRAARQQRRARHALLSVSCSLAS